MPIATLAVFFAPRACTRTVEPELHPFGVPAGLPDEPDLPGWLLPEALPSVAWLGGERAEVVSNWDQGCLDAAMGELIEMVGCGGAELRLGTGGDQRRVGLGGDPFAEPSGPVWLDDRHVAVSVGAWGRGRLVVVGLDRSWNPVDAPDETWLEPVRPVDGKLLVRITAARFEPWGWEPRSPEELKRYADGVDEEGWTGDFVHRLYLLDLRDGSLAPTSLLW